VIPIEIEGPLDPNFAWNGRVLYDEGGLRPGSEKPQVLRGAAAAVLRDMEGSYRIIRDPLGINKLFWVDHRDGGVLFAARPRRLIDRGYPLSEVRSIPSGSVVDVPASGQAALRSSIRPDRWFASTAPDRSIEDLGKEIHATLTGYLAAVADAYPSTDVFVCLSGGLDSSGIAALAREVFPNLIAACFDIQRPGSGPSEDRAAAERVARDFSMPLLDVTVSAEALLQHIDTVLIEGVDWRDFNVHTALVNAALADAIAGASAPPRRPAIVFTGDLANEFLVDYHAEYYRGVAYYRLPRLDPLALRASLIRGLDTCHREVGVFVANGLSLVQPYAVAVDAYMTLPADFLAIEDRKQRLNRVVLGNRLPEYVYARTKVRAQIGSSDGGGVLGACLDRGIDQRWLARRFAQLHDTDVGELTRFLRAGVYRTGVPFAGVDDGRK
jgi:asparagine synthetase B (glutamine-hydrolysing)